MTLATLPPGLSKLTTRGRSRATTSRNARRSSLYSKAPETKTKAGPLPVRCTAYPRRASASLATNPVPIMSPTINSFDENISDLPQQHIINAQGPIFWQAAQSEVMIQGKRRLLAAIVRSQSTRSATVPAAGARAAGKVVRLRIWSRLVCRYGFTRSGCAAWKAGRSAHLASMATMRLKAVNSTPQRRAL